MRKIINGSRYDTDGARLLHEHCTEITNNLDHLTERLYRTKSGKYFIHGEGGPRTRYAGRSADGWDTSGEAICPLSEDAARVWAETHMDAEQLEAVFGSIDNGRVQRSVYISPAADKKLEDLKASTGLAISQIIDAAILAYGK